MLSRSPEGAVGCECVGRFPDGHRVKTIYSGRAKGSDGQAVRNGRQVGHRLFIVWPR